jgi:trigger factor
MSVNAVTSNQVNVSVEAKGGLERSMTVRVPTAEIEQEVGIRLAKVGKTVRLKGFRPGKVPAKVLRQHYGGQVRKEVVGDVIRSSLAQALAQENLNAAGGPSIELLNEGDDSHFSYRATFEIYPEIALGGFDEISIEAPRVQVGEADVDSVIEKLREQRAHWHAVERNAVSGDRVVVDFNGTIGGEPFEGGEGKDVTIVVGGGQVIEDFDKALKGLAASQSRSVKVKFPKDYPVEALAGKKAVFEITVKRVEEKHLPELNDAFAKEFAVEDGGLAKLRDEVRANMQRELAARKKSVEKRRVLDGLLEANPLDVPKALVEDEVAAMQANAMRQLRIEDPEKAPPRGSFREGAKRRVALALLMQEIIRRRDIKVDTTRVDERVNELAAAYEQPQLAARQYRASRELMAQLESGVLEDQVVEALLAEARTIEKPMSFQEFMQ